MGRMAQASLAALGLLTPLFDGECAIPRHSGRDDGRHRRLRSP
jgi:hypothetical protein